MKLLRLVAAFGLVCGLTIRAEAQTCVDGRVRVDGHCCWPGQSWSADDRACVGAPACPAGLAEEGESCVARVAAAVPAVPPVVVVPVPIASGAPDPAGWPALPGGRPDGVANPVLTYDLDWMLVGGGIGALAADWLVSIIVAGIDDRQRLCYSDPFSGGETACPTNWPVSFVPVVGGLIYAFLPNAPSGGYATNQIGPIPQVITATGQVIGLICLLVGIVQGSTQITSLDLGGGVELSLRSGGDGGDAAFTF